MAVYFACVLFTSRSFVRSILAASLSLCLFSFFPPSLRLLLHFLHKNSFIFHSCWFFSSLIISMWYKYACNILWRIRKRGEEQKEERERVRVTNSYNLYIHWMLVLSFYTHSSKTERFSKWKYNFSYWFWKLTIILKNVSMILCPFLYTPSCFRFFCFPFGSF